MDGQTLPAKAYSCQFPVAGLSLWLIHVGNPVFVSATSEEKGHHTHGAEMRAQIGKYSVSV